MKKLTADQVEFKVLTKPEWIPVRGNLIASGNDAEDTAAENEVLARLNRGDTLAWCIVVVEASWNGLTGTASLGGCSLENRAALEETVEWHGLKEEALEDLNQQLGADDDDGWQVEQSVWCAGVAEWCDAVVCHDSCLS